MSQHLFHFIRQSAIRWPTSLIGLFLFGHGVTRLNSPSMQFLQQYGKVALILGQYEFIFKGQCRLTFFILSPTYSKHQPGALLVLRCTIAFRSLGHCSAFSALCHKQMVCGSAHFLHSCIVTYNHVTYNDKSRFLKQCVFVLVCVTFFDA